MNTEHLSDEEIQQWALDKEKSSAANTAHIHDCELCKMKAAAYQVLFEAIEGQPKPAFDFDLSVSLLPQFVIEPEAKQKNILPFVALAAFIVGIIITICYTYKKSIALFYKTHLREITSGVSTSVMYLLLTTAIAILIFQSVALYKKYQQKIDELNFY